MAARVNTVITLFSETLFSNFKITKFVTSQKTLTYTFFRCCQDVRNVHCSVMNGYRHSDIGGWLTRLGGCVAFVVHCSRNDIGLSVIRETIQRVGTKSPPSFVACGQFRLCLWGMGWGGDRMPVWQRIETWSTSCLLGEQFYSLVSI